MADLKLRPLPQPHIPLVSPINEQAAQAFYEYWKDADRILRAVAKFVNEDEPYQPDFATDGDVYAAAANDKVLTTERLATAAAPVAITDGSSPTFDWAAGVNRTWVLSANRTVPNPTNVQPGTWRTIRAIGADGSSRSIGFGSNFAGDIPTVAVTNSAPMLLTFFAVSATRILVSAMKA
ncbi:hypothetical protein W911_14345 [Hyphomicrobium nitrativorans NL23]|uniref:Uncharacterized protein n=1 Tax=Hyphomicrobium nitrativorans NL23 TaxID=1029756 RepID=V5SHJ8_9HYPH|nr:hypothetical protein [Hyphomicrobium nitrativorans]AHB50326.1 hypothetical protein W911_14345 [Hyphomicrobium nitrativorans NL23]